MMPTLDMMKVAEFGAQLPERLYDTPSEGQCFNWIDMKQRSIILVLNVDTKL